jgi:hypothetical protein
MCLITALELARWDPKAVPKEKKKMRENLTPITKYIKTMRQEHEESNYLRSFIFPSTRQKVVDHLKTVRNKSYACLKPRDKILNKNSIAVAA